MIQKFFERNMKQAIFIAALAGNTEGVQKCLETTEGDVPVIKDGQVLAGKWIPAGTQPIDLQE